MTTRQGLTDDYEGDDKDRWFTSAERYDELHATRGVNNEKQIQESVDRSDSTNRETEKPNDQGNDRGE